MINFILWTLTVCAAIILLSITIGIAASILDEVKNYRK